MYGDVGDNVLLSSCFKHCVLQMEWRRLSQLSHDSIPFENLMHGPTLCSNVEFTEESMAILDNLMLVQENVRVARGMKNPSFEQIEDDCVTMH